MVSYEFWFYYHLPQILAGTLGAMTCAGVYHAVQAWRDVVKLDAQEQLLSRSLLDPLVRRYMPKGEIMVHDLRMRLQQAGMRGDDAMARYVRWRVTGVATAVIVNTFLLLGQASFTTWVVYGGLSAFMGYFWPTMFQDAKKYVQGRDNDLKMLLKYQLDLQVA